MLLGSAAYSASWERKTIGELAKQADVVLIGSIASTESMVIENEVSIDTKAINPSLQTVITLDNVDVVTQDGLVALGGTSEIYLDGGIVRMPMSLRSRYPKHKYYGVINTAVPVFNSQYYQRMFIFLCGNGSALSPFCNGSDGVYPIDLNGYVRNTNDQLLVRLDNGNFGASRVPMQFVPKINTEPERPSNLATSNDQSKEQYISAAEFADFIRMNTSVKSINADIVRNSVRPKLRK